MSRTQNIKLFRQVLPVVLGAIVILVGLMRGEASVMALGAGLLGMPALLPGGNGPVELAEPVKTGTHSPEIVPGLEEQLEENDEDYIEYRD